MTGRRIPAAAFVLFCFSFGLQAQIPAGPAEELTLGQAVDQAMATHPLLRAAESRVNAAADRVQSAKANRTPDLRITEAFSRGNNPVFAFGSLLEQSRFGPENLALSSLNDPASINNFRATLSSRLSVFDGRQTSSRIGQAEAGETSAVEQRMAMEQRLRFEVIRSYYGVILARAVRDVAVQASRLAEADVALVRSRLDAGLVIDSDVLAAQVQLADFLRQQIQAEGDAIAAEAELNILIGRPDDSLLRLSSPDRGREFSIAPQGDLIRMALAQRPDFAASQSLLKSSGLAVQERRGESLPQVGVFANVGISGRNPVTGSSDYAVGASVTLNLFDAGRDARLSEARHNEAAAIAERDDTERQIRIEVIRARQRVLTAGEQVRASQTSVGQAREVLRVTEDRYMAGLTTITALLRAQTDAVRAEMNLIASQNAYATGYAGLLLSTGALNDVTSFLGQ